MIDSSFLCSSSWEFTDPLHDLSDVPFIPFDDCFDGIERSCTTFENSSRHSDSSSNTSSDYENVYFGDLIFPIEDSFISGILEDDDDSIGLEDDWSIQKVESSNVPVDDNSNVKSTSKRKRNSLDSLPNKLWSRMSPAEQLETLHKLSKIVTSHMDIREQIKVIKIIDPGATISPNDTEFALDVSRLNDEKMKRIQELVRKHKFSLSNSSKKLSSSKTISQKQSQSSKLFSGRTASKTKRKQKKQKSSIDEDVRQKRKLELHGQKEMRSGLFVYEKVVKLSSPVEDEDVNILE